MGCEGVRGSGRLQAEAGRRPGEVQRHFCGSELLPSCQLTRHSSQTPYGLYTNGLQREGAGSGNAPRERYSNMYLILEMF